VDVKFGTQKVKITLTKNSWKTIIEIYVQFNERQVVRWDSHNTKSANGILFFNGNGNCSMLSYVQESSRGMVEFVRGQYVVYDTKLVV